MCATSIGYPVKPRRRLPQMFSVNGVSPFDSILEVGCGDGRVLDQFWMEGFRRLAGIDPLMDDTSFGHHPFPLTSTTVEQVHEKFDAVLFHHTLEHLPDPLTALQHASRLLARTTGMIIIRLPVKDSAAWREYGTDWVQLDAPRHEFVPTSRGIEILAGRMGFRVRSRAWLSSGVQFWASDQYRRDIPLTSEQSHLISRKNVRPEILEELEQRAAALNAAGDGDDCMFFLERVFDGH